MQLPPILQKDVSFLGLCSCRNRKVQSTNVTDPEMVEVVARFWNRGC